MIVESFSSAGDWKNLWIAAGETSLLTADCFGECKIFNCWGILGPLDGELAFLGDLRGMRISDDLYWGVRNLVDSCWRGMTEDLQFGGTYLCGEKVN